MHAVVAGIVAYAVAGGTVVHTAAIETDGTDLLLLRVENLVLAIWSLLFLLFLLRLLFMLLLVGLFLMLLLMGLLSLL